MSATPLSAHKHNQPIKYVCLNEWWLAKPRLPLQGLAVDGIAYGQRERKFLSTVIAKRYEANVLETEDGVTLQLRGFINTSRSSQNGFPLNVCEDFLLGFPDDWQKYAAQTAGAKCVDGDTRFGEPNGCSQKRAADASPFSIHDNHSVERHDISVSDNGIQKEKRKICNGPENSTSNVSEQSVSANIVGCRNSEKTVEGEGEDNTASLKSSQSVVAMMDNGEKGVSVAAPVSQVGNPNNDQSSMGIGTSRSSYCKEEHVRHNKKYRKRMSTCPVRRSPRLLKKGNAMG